jgi:hypothetical protein
MAHDARRRLTQRELDRLRRLRPAHVERQRTTLAGQLCLEREHAERQCHVPTMRVEAEARVGGVAGERASVRVEHRERRAGGSFSSIGGIAANRLAWFDGAGWHPIASSAVGTVKYAIARPNGEVVVVGEFPNVLTGGMDFVARWIGGSLRTAASGLPASAASIGVFGFAPVLQPLAQLHPLGAPGCYLLTTDDILLQFTVTGGAALPDLPVPNTPALVGGQFLHQVLGVELDAAGHPAAITSSNALLLTVGAL